MRMREGSPARIAWLVIAGLLVFMVAFAVGCGGDDDDEGGDGAEPVSELGEPEGEVNLVAWAGYVEDGSTDPAVDWVSRLREGDRVQGQRQDRQHLRRDGAADADRPVRRRLGVG